MPTPTNLLSLARDQSRPVIRLHKHGFQASDTLSEAAQADGSPILDTLNSKLTSILEKALADVETIKANRGLTTFGRFEAIKKVHSKAAEQIREDTKYQTEHASRLLTLASEKLPTSGPPRPKDLMEQADAREIRDYLRTLSPVESEGALKRAAAEGRTSVIAAAIHDPLSAVKPLLGSDTVKSEVVDSWIKATSPELFDAFDGARETTMAVNHNMKLAGKILGEKLGAYSQMDVSNLASEPGD